jgi:hypothetical protein
MQFALKCASSFVSIPLFQGQVPFGVAILGYETRWRNFEALPRQTFTVTGSVMGNTQRSVTY